MSEEWQLTEFATFNSGDPFDPSRKYGAVIRLTGDYERGQERCDLAKEQAREPLLEAAERWKKGELVTRAVRVNEQLQSARAELANTKDRLQAAKGDIVVALTNDADPRPHEQLCIQLSASVALIEERVVHLQRIAANARTLAVNDLRGQLSATAEREAKVCDELYAAELACLREACAELIDRCEVAAKLKAWHGRKHRPDLIDGVLQEGVAALPVVEQAVKGVGTLPNTQPRLDQSNNDNGVTWQPLTT